MEERRVFQPVGSVRSRQYTAASLSQHETQHDRYKKQAGIDGEEQVGAVAT